MLKQLKSSSKHSWIMMHSLNIVIQHFATIETPEIKALISPE